MNLAAPVRVALLGMYSSANLGDVAIQQAVIDALRIRRPNIAFTAVCTDPRDAMRTFGFPARSISGFGPLHESPESAPNDQHDWLRQSPWPIQRAAAWWLIRRHMRTQDMLLVSGSGQIDDFWGGPWEQPMRLLAWTHAARRLGRQAAYFGVGFDQLLTPWGRGMVRRALNLAQLRVFRDQGSVQALQALGFDADCAVSPDPAFHLLPPWHGESAVSGPPFGVICPIARSAWPGQDDEAHKHYVQALAACADWMQSHGLQVRFACSQTRMDPPMIAPVRAAMKTDAGAAVVLSPGTVHDYMRAVRGARVVLASRLHALILAMVAGTPVVAISYARKVAQQMLDARLSAFDISYEGLELQRLLAASEAAWSDHAVLSAQIGRFAQGNRQKLEAHFDRLAMLLPNAPLQD